MRALITGSSKGIGRETAIALAEAGWDVCLHGRDAGHIAEALAAVKRSVARKEQIITSVQGDLTSLEDCGRIVTEATAALAGLDALVNNAGIAMRGSFAEVNPEVWDRVLRVNVLAPAALTRAAVPELRRSSGSVVFVSSAVGLWGFPLVSAYSASKHALNGLVQSLRTELAGSGVHVGIAYVGIVQNDPDKRILKEDGSTFVPAARPHGMSQRFVAKRIVRMIVRRRSRDVLSAGARATSFLARFFPRLLAFALKRAGSRIEKYAK